MIPYDDPTLAAFIDGTASGGGTSKASPYTIAMQRMNITGLPHLINAIMLTSVFSCGNGVLFASSRALFVMGQNGRAPKIFAKTTKRGVPVYAVGMVILIGLLAMMGASDSSSTVLGYLIDLVTVCGQFNYVCVCITYAHFHFTLKKRGISRDSLPYKGKFQPYASYIGMTMGTLAMLFLGFDTLKPFDIKWFFIDYTLLAVFPIMAILWKVIKKTKYVPVGTGDLGLGGIVKEIDDYEDRVVPEPEGIIERFFSGMWEWKDLVKCVQKRHKA